MSTLNEDSKKGTIDLPDYQNELYDFSSSATPSFLEFLQIFRISVAVTSYDCQRLIVFRQKNDNIDTLLVPMARPRGLAAVSYTHLRAHET